MRTVSLRLVDLQRATIPIGFEGENDYTRVILDCKKMFDEEPTYVPALSIVSPSGDKYPGVVTREGNNVYWDVSAADLTAKGYGEIQLAFVKDEIVGKTWIAKTHVNRSIIPSGTTPTPIANFIIEASEIVNGIPQAIQDALAEAKASGEFDGADGQDGQDGFSPVVEITAISGGYSISITDATGTHTAQILNGTPGTPGDDGYSPTVSITGITGGHRITITDKTGDHSADVMDGEDGDDGVSPTVTVTTITGGHQVTITDATGDHTFNVMDGESGANIIDDTAGSGDTGRTWSANKLNSDVMTAINKLDPDATTEDIGKTLIAKVVSNGKVTEYEFGETAGEQVAVSDTQPTEESNVLWIVEDDQGDTYTVPTTSEMNTALAGKIDKPSTAGTNGQVLTSDGNGGQSWETPGGGSGTLPSGGTTGQFLVKVSNTDYDTEWVTVPAASGVSF